MFVILGPRKTHMEERSPGLAGTKAYIECELELLRILIIKLEDRANTAECRVS